MSLARMFSISIGFILLIAGAVAAQQTSTPPTQQPGGNENRIRTEGLRRHGMRPRKSSLTAGQRDALRQINLTDEQRQQRHAILQRHSDALKIQRDQLFQFRQRKMEGSLTTEDRERARALRQQFRLSMEGIRGELRNTLTTEQRAQIDQRREERKQRREEFMKRRDEFRKTNPR